MNTVLPNVPIPCVLIAMLVVAHALWLRGLVKSNQGDLIAGWCVLVFASIVGIAVDMIPVLGVPVVVFGIATVAVGAFCGAACPLKRGSRVGLSLALVLVGTMMLLVL
jgi:hypothetical protein